MRSLGLVLFLVFATAFAERRIKIGFVVGPESSRRESSDKFWSFSRPPSSPLLLEPIAYRLPRWGAREIANAVCDAALRGARGLVVLCPPRLSSLADSYSSRLRLPLVTPSGGEGGLHVALLPETSEAASALLRDASSFAFLYDTETGADQLSSILSLMQKNEDGEPGDLSPPWVEGFWRVHGLNDSLSFLRSLPDQVNRVVLGISSEKLADDIFAGLGDSRPMHGLLLGTTTVSGAGNVLRSTITKFSVSGVGAVAKEDLENRWRTLEDWRGDEKDMPTSAVWSHDAIRVMYSVLEQLPPEWTDSNPPPSNIDCFNYTEGLPEGDDIDMKAISGSGVTGAFKFGENGRRTGFTLDITEINSYGSKKIGTWSNSSGLHLNPDRRQILQAERQRRDPPIRVTSIEVRPFLQKVATGGAFEGFVVDLIEELRRVTGRSFQLQIVADGKYGWQQKDGRWTGMVGEIIDNVTDMVIAPLTKTTERGRFVLFGKTFMTVGISILLKRPPLLDYHGATSFGPLSPLTVWSPWQWTVVALLLLLSAALGCAASRFVSVPDRVRALETKGKDGLSPCGSLWFACGALLVRDTGIYPRSLTHRLLSAAWWFLCIVLAVLYVSSLSAEVVRTRTTLITTHSSRTAQQLLEDLLRKGSPIITTIKNGSTPQFFRNSQIGLYREYGRYIDSRPEILTKNYSEGVKKVKEGGGDYAFLMESLSAEYEANQPPCDTLVSSGYLATKSYATAMRLDNPILRDVMDDGILNLQESGVLRQLYEKWWHNYTDYCSDPNRDILPKVYSSSITLHEASGGFVVLIVGALVAVVGAVVENYIASRRVTFLE